MRKGSAAEYLEPMTRLKMLQAAKLNIAGGCIGVCMGGWGVGVCMGVGGISWGFVEGVGSIGVCIRGWGFGGFYGGSGVVWGIGVWGDLLGVCMGGLGVFMGGWVISWGFVRVGYYYKYVIVASIP